MGDAGLVAATVDGVLGAAIVQSAGRELAEVQAELDSANPHIAGFDLPLTASLDVRLERQPGAGHNVIGWLPPTRTAEIDKPYILLGAHYDHLGHGRGGDSLARSDEVGQVHNGADDNASGVAAVLGVGDRLADVERERGVILAFWSGEELGLLGSDDFVERPPVPTEEIAAYINFDMVGRLRENIVNVQAVGSSSIWTGLVEELNEPVGLTLSFVSDPYLPTDVRSLNDADVPSLNFFTGSHEEYHRPTDDADTINYEGIAKIVDLAAAVTASLALRPEPPDFVEVEREEQQGGTAMMRIYTGNHPGLHAGNGRACPLRRRRRRPRGGGGHRRGRRHRQPRRTRGGRHLRLHVRLGSASGRPAGRSDCRPRRRTDHRRTDSPRARVAVRAADIRVPDGRCPGTRRFDYCSRRTYLTSCRGPTSAP